MKKAIPLLTALLLATACGGRTEASGMGEGMMADSVAMDHEMASPGAMGAGAMGDSNGMSMEERSGMGDQMHDASGMGTMKADTSGAGGMM